MKEEVVESVQSIVGAIREAIETGEQVVDEADSLTLHLGEIESAKDLLADVEPVVEPAVESVVDRLAETAYRLVSARLGDIVIGPTTLLTVLRHTMEVVEGSIASGNEQKELAIVLIKRLICDAGMAGPDFALCVSLVDDGIIGNTIDLVVDASKGKIGVNAVKVATSCCLGFLAHAQAKRQKRKQEKRRAAELA